MLLGKVYLTIKSLGVGVCAILEVLPLAGDG